MKTQSGFQNVAQSQTDAVLVASPAANKRIVVTGLTMQPGGTGTSITFNSKGTGSGTAISPAYANAANALNVLPFNPDGWFSTNAGEALTCTTGAGSTTGLTYTYRIQ